MVKLMDFVDIMNAWKNVNEGLSLTKGELSEREDEFQQTLDFPMIYPFHKT